MVTRTYLDKCTTIFRGNSDNFGLNPIGMLNYGRLLSRCLIHFNIDEIKKLYDNGIIIDKNKVKHTLKLTNCGSVDPKVFDEMVPSNREHSVKERATSFTVILFEIPERWDEGVGFDNSSDFWLFGKKSASKQSCNWFQSYNGKEWENEGIYTNQQLDDEYQKYGNGEDSIIIGRQIFDHGNEDFEFDITSYVQKLIEDDSKHNFGLGLAFSPMTERLTSKLTQYVGFFTNNTNTFFEPYVETRYYNKISDDRYTFALGKTNKLYFYSNIGGFPTNLDSEPTCEIDGVNYEVKREGIGVYCAEVNLPMQTYSPNTILYDVWDNIVYSGNTFEPVEMEFVTHTSNDYFTFGKPSVTHKNLTALVSSINDGETLLQGEKRHINVIFKEPYNKTDYELSDNSEYRIYVMDGKREVTVIDWDYIDREGDKNSFVIDTSFLLPHHYYVDVRINYGKEHYIFHKCLDFKVSNDNTYQKL